MVSDGRRARRRQTGNFQALPDDLSRCRGHLKITVSSLRVMRVALVAAAFAAPLVLAAPGHAQSPSRLSFEAVWIGPTASFVVTPGRSVDLGGELSLFYGRPAAPWGVGFTLGGSEQRAYGEVLYSRRSGDPAGAIPFVTVVALGPVYDHYRFNEIGGQLSLSEMIIPFLPFTANLCVYPREPPVIAVGLSLMLGGGF
jgi:hypothetical protein